MVTFAPGHRRAKADRKNEESSPDAAPGPRGATRAAVAPATTIPHASGPLQRPPLDIHSDARLTHPPEGSQSRRGFEPHRPGFGSPDAFSHEARGWAAGPTDGHMGSHKRACRRTPTPPARRGRTLSPRPPMPLTPKRPGSNVPRQKLGSTPTTENRHDARIDTRHAWIRPSGVPAGTHRQRRIAFGPKGQRSRSCGFRSVFVRRLVK